MMIRSTPPQITDGAPDHDTQPLPEWVFEAYRSKLGSSQNRTGGDVCRGGIAAATLAPATDQESEDDQIDLLTGFQQSRDGRGEDESNCSHESVQQDTEPLGTSPVGAPDPSSPERYVLAKTPRQQSNEQLGRNEAPSTATTPALPVNPFTHKKATADGVMGLSQVFRATQAITPLRHKVITDPLTDRPSPDIYNGCQSYLQAFVSSPMQITKSSPRVLPEMKDTYTSPAASEDEREEAPRGFRSSSINHRDVEDVSEDDLGPGLSQEVRKRLQKQRKDDELQEMLSKITAAKRVPQIEPRRKKRGGPQQSSAMGVLQTRRLLGLLSSDTEQGNFQCEATESSIYHGRKEKPYFENKNPTVLSECRGNEKLGTSSDRVQVPMSTNCPRSKLEAHSSIQESPLSILRPDRRLQNARDSLASDSKLFAPQTVLANSHDPAELVVVQGTQVENIADSQTFQTQREQPGTMELLGSMTGRQFLTNSELFDSETQSTIVQACSNNETTGNRKFYMEKSSASEVSSASKHVLDSSPPRAQYCTMQVSDIEVTPHSSDLYTKSLARLKTRAELPDPGRVALLLQAAPQQAEHQEIICDELQLVHASPTETSGSGSQKQTQRNAAEKSAPSPFRQTSVHPDLTIPETSPPAGSRLPTPGFESSRNAVCPEHVTSPSRITCLSHLVGADEQHGHSSGITNTARTILSQDAAIIPGGRSEPSLVRDPPEETTNCVGPHRTRLIRAQNHSAPQEQEQPSLTGTNHDSRNHKVTTPTPLQPARKRRKGNDGSRIEKKDDHHARRTSTRLRASRRITITSQAMDNGEVQSRTDHTQGDRRAEPLNTPIDDPKTWEKTLDASLNPSQSAKRRLDDDTFLREPENVADSGTSSTTGHRARSRRSDTNSDHDQAVVDRNEDSRQDYNINGLARVESDTNVAQPHRVFALFKGVNHAYYPATCLCNVSSTECQVRFDDGNTDILRSAFIRRLDLRAGDVVKVDQSERRKKTFVIVGLEGRRNYPSQPHVPSDQTEVQGQDDKQYPKTDVSGCWMAILTLKNQDQGRRPRSGLKDLVRVPVADLYIPQSQWARFEDRVHSHTSWPLPPGSRCLTPSEGVISETYTPRPRSRRAKTATPVKNPSRLYSATPGQLGSGLFKNMIFAVSYAGHDEEKTRVTKQVILNGGTILNEGLNELFLTDDPADLARDRLPMPSPELQNHGLSIKSSWARAGFVCVIADQYSRKEKYIQALALGLPCLAGRWIEDCVQENALVDWEPYLLPSGESSFLGDAIRSRTIRCYPAETADLSATIRSRPKFFDGKSVLFVETAKGTPNSQADLVFLIRALGSSSVGQARNIKAANAALAKAHTAGGRPWDFVYDSARESDPIRLRLCNSGGGVTLAGTKRKRSSIKETTLKITKENDDVSLDPNNRPTKIIDIELLVQSLVLGRLLEK